MKLSQIKIIRIIVTLSILILIYQMVIFTPQKPFLDSAFLTPNNSNWELASSAKISNNITKIYPYFRNMMGKIIMIKLEFFALNNTPTTFNDYLSGQKLNSSSQSIWVLKTDKKLTNPNDFSSQWSINEWTISGFTKKFHYLMMTIKIYNSNSWSPYDFLYLSLSY